MLPFDDGCDEYNEHEQAWLAKDWDHVQALADQYKEKEEADIFKTIKNINQSKHEQYVDQDYSKYMIDNLLSQHIDCIHTVYMSNLLMSGLSDQSHLNYLIQAIPAGKRYAGKSAQLSTDIKQVFILKLLMKRYQINYDSALMYKQVLEKKNCLEQVLKQCKGLVTDELIKSVTKVVKEQNELKKLL